ncbi:MAG TPA: hypothetical protein VLW85_02690 [Myxococcales bacterium]|nr:hypothetical protein [Myxococcales bacterium]
MLSKSLLSELRARKDEPDAAVARWGEAFLLDPGLDPALWLLADGRVVVDERALGNDIHEASDEEAIGAIVVGTSKTGVHDLLTLLPTRPPHATECARCGGNGWVPLGRDLVCPKCHGAGWR